jgi:hypothetical protein
MRHHHSQHNDRVLLLTLAALVLVVFGEAIFGGRVFYERDVQLIWHAQADAFVRVLSAGSWPLWNPYNSFGQPLLANPNTEVLYPLTWLNLLMRPESYYSLFVVSHFLLTSAGFFLLARRLGMSGLASFVGSAAWILSGPLLSMVQLWSHLAGAAWLPWTLLAADTAFSRGRREHIVLWGLTMAAQVLVGCPESLFASFLLALGLGLRHLTWPPRWGGQIRRLLSVALLAGFSGLALSAAQWLPTLSAARQTPRLAPPESVRTFWSIHPLQAIEIGLPLELDRLPLPEGLRARLFESREAFLPSLYAGLPVLALVAAAVATRQRRSLVVLAVGVIATLLALGRHTPVYSLAVVALPPLGAFRYPAKAMIVTSFALALLAGMGLDACREGGLPRRRRLVFVVAPLTVVVLACTTGALLASGVLPSVTLAGSAGSALAQVLAPAAERLTTAAVLGAVMLALQLRAAGAGAGSWGAIAMAIVAVLEIFAAHRGLNRTAPRELYTLPPPALDLVSVNDRSRLYVFDYALPGRSERYLGHGGGFVLANGLPVPWLSAAALRTYLHPFTLASFGIEGSYVADTILLYPPYLETLTRAVFDAEETPAELRLLQAGAVSHVIALHDRGFESLIPVAIRPSLFLEPIRVFRVPDPLPRTFAVGTVRVEDDRASLRLLGDPALDLRNEALASDGPAFRAPPSFTGSSEIQLWRPDRARIRAEVSHRALVVLVDTYDPGWSVTVDGHAAVARRANVCFRGVEVPSGRHQIDWVYRPKPVLAGFVVSGLAVAVAAAIALSPRSRDPGGVAPRSSR